MTMSRRGAAALVGAVVVLAAGSLRAARAEDGPKPGAARNAVVGAWSCVQNLPGGQTRAFELRLRQEGEALVGSVWVAEGEATVRGQLVDDGFRLEVESDQGTYEVKGKVDGDAIGGTWALGPEHGTWEGKRKATS